MDTISYRTSIYRDHSAKDYCDHNSKMVGEGWTVQNSGFDPVNGTWWAIYIKRYVV